MDSADMADMVVIADAVSAVQDFSQSKHLHSSYVSHSISLPSEQHSSCEFSDQLSSSHLHSDLSHNALQLDQLTSSYQSDLGSQSSHLSLSSLSDSPLPPESHHELPSVPFPPKACATSPSHTTSHHLCISHPSYSVYRITMRASVYSHRFPDRLYMFKAICDFLKHNHLVSIIYTHKVQKARFIKSFYVSPEVPVGSNCL